MIGKMCKNDSLTWINTGKTNPKMEIFHFDKATDTIDVYVVRLKQCAQILCYNEGQPQNLSKTPYPQDTQFLFLFKSSERHLRALSML